MFFVMRDFVDVGKTFPRRVGSPTSNWTTAKRLALKHKGYIMNEGRELLGQAMCPNAPRYLETTTYIGSGEDVYV